MEALLCDEVWLMSPQMTFDDDQHDHTKQFSSEQKCSDIKICGSFYAATKEDCESMLKTYIHKEINHLPQLGFVQLLESSHFISNARIKAIQWLFLSQIRFTLSFGTIFNAANYFDRFISMNQCHGWKYWMFELLSMACLSIASKFSETAPPPFHEMQEGLDYSFEPGLIQRMELTLLKAIGWGLNCVTTYSYVELMTWEMNDDFSIKNHLVEEITSQLTELLATSLLDYRLLAFRPCIIALTAFKRLHKERFSSTGDAHIDHITSFIPQVEKVNMINCEKFFVEEMHLAERFDKVHLACYPTSPVTVLTKARVEISDQQVDFSLIFKMPESLNNISLIKSAVKKRKRDGN